MARCDMRTDDCIREGRAPSIAWTEPAGATSGTLDASRRATSFSGFDIHLFHHALIRDLTTILLFHVIRINPCMNPCVSVGMPEARIF
ncbi:hypothetical protein Aduo_018325 [Ancylostoma duodenale]